MWPLVWPGVKTNCAPATHLGAAFFVQNDFRGRLSQFFQGVDDPTGTKMGGVLFGVGNIIRVGQKNIIQAPMASMLFTKCLVKRGASTIQFSLSPRMKKLRAPYDDRSL